MKDAPAVAETLIPPALKRTMNNKPTTSQEQMEGTSANQDKSPPRKKKPPKASTSESADLFEATTAGANMEVSMLFSKFAQVLSEKAAADTSQMKELEGILTGARSLETYLREKKKHLRQTLALISEKLQG